MPSPISHSSKLIHDNKHYMLLLCDKSQKKSQCQLLKKREKKANFVFVSYDKFSERLSIVYVIFYKTFILKIDVSNFKSIVN